MEEFRVGTLALAWDEEEEKVIVEAGAITDVEEPAEPLTDDLEPDGPDALRVRLTGAMARAFTVRALEVVSAGRPPLPAVHAGRSTPRVMSARGRTVIAGVRRDHSRTGTRRNRRSRHPVSR